MMIFTMADKPRGYAAFTKRRHMVVSAKGGMTRADNLTPKRRSEIASLGGHAKAAKARAAAEKAKEAERAGEAA